MEKPETPELNKQAEAAEKLGTEAIGEFLAWLPSQRIHLAVWDTSGEWMLPWGGSVERLLATYAGVDLKKVDEERRAWLEYIRAEHAGGG
jgi:hypothetical protein